MPRLMDKRYAEQAIRDRTKPTSDIEDPGTNAARIEVTVALRLPAERQRRSPFDAVTRAVDDRQLDNRDSWPASVGRHPVYTDHLPHRKAEL